MITITVTDSRPVNPRVVTLQANDAGNFFYPELDKDGKFQKAEKLTLPLKASISDGKKTRAMVGRVVGRLQLMPHRRLEPTRRPDGSWHRSEPRPTRRSVTRHGRPSRVNPGRVGWALTVGNCWITPRSRLQAPIVNSVGHDLQARTERLARCSAASGTSTRSSARARWRASMRRRTETVGVRRLKSSTPRSRRTRRRASASSARAISRTR